MKLQEDLYLVPFFSLACILLVKGQLSPDCQSKCGNIPIEYPFGTSSGCYSIEDVNFNLTCDGENKLRLHSMEVISTSHSGQLRVRFPVSYVCYDSQNVTSGISYETMLGSLSLSQNNRFTAVGCNTYSLMTTIREDRNHSTGCMSLCDSPPPANAFCTGEGCCQTSLLAGINHFTLSSRRFADETSVTEFSPCFYVFLVENGEFNFSASEDLKNLRDVKSFPVLLDWSIGNKTCEQVGSGSLCGENSRCFDSSRGIGYTCQCNEGYNGNPYLLNGCKDIGECTIRKHNSGMINTVEIRKQTLNLSALLVTGLILQRVAHLKTLDGLSFFLEPPLAS